MISAISPHHVIWASDKNESLQVLFIAGFPEPNVTWTRQLTGSTHYMPITADGYHFQQSGTHLLNLTVNNVVPEDAGKYSLRTLNSQGRASLWFQVDVLGMCIYKLKVDLFFFLPEKLLKNTHELYHTPIGSQTELTINPCLSMYSMHCFIIYVWSNQGV